MRDVATSPIHFPEEIIRERNPSPVSEVSTRIGSPVAMEFPSIAQPVALAATVTNLGDLVRVVQSQARIIADLQERIRGMEEAFNQHTHRVTYQRADYRLNNGCVRTYGSDTRTSRPLL